MSQQFLGLYRYDRPTVNPRTGRTVRWVPKDQGGTKSVFRSCWQDAVAALKPEAPAGSKLAAIDYWPNGRDHKPVRIHL